VVALRLNVTPGFGSGVRERGESAVWECLSFFPSEYVSLKRKGNECCKLASDACFLLVDTKYSWMGTRLAGTASSLYFLYGGREAVCSRLMCMHSTCQPPPRRAKAAR